MRLSKYLPYENYTYTTALDAGEVMQRILMNVEPKKYFRVWKKSNNGQKPYEGEYYGHCFSISRIINYRNSFLPVIKGNISSGAGITYINVKMRLHLTVLIFMCFWLGGVGSGCLIFTLSAIGHAGQAEKQSFSPAFLIPYGMFIFGWLLMLLAFKAESKKSKIFLAELFQAKELNN